MATLKKVTASPAKFLAAATPATLALLTTTCLQVPQWQDFGYWMYTRGLLKHRIAASTLATSEYCRA
jgi:hypothetical protein